jgi:hypothetical protein
MWSWKLMSVLVACSVLVGCATAPTIETPTQPSTQQDEFPCAWEDAFPTETAQVIWPELAPIKTEGAAPGDELEIIAVGGYLQWDNECGESVNESARTFQLYFDDEPAGTIQCYVNTCRGTIVIPAGTSPGAHKLSVEGGSSVVIDLVAP